MSLAYMGVPDRCEHGEYEDKECPQCELKRLRGAVAYLRSQASVERITAIDSRKFPPIWQGEAAWWPVKVWKEFERRVSGE